MAGNLNKHSSIQTQTQKPHVEKQVQHFIPSGDGSETGQTPTDSTRTEDSAGRFVSCFKALQ